MCQENVGSIDKYQNAQEFIARRGDVSRGQTPHTAAADYICPFQSTSAAPSLAS